MNDTNESQAAADDAHVNGVDTQATGKGRRKTRAEERIEALDTSLGRRCSSRSRMLQARAETAEAETESVRGQWQRTAADFANYKRRSEEDRFRELGLASEGLLRKVLGVADDLARALEHVPPDQQGSAWVEGIAAIERKVGGTPDGRGRDAHRGCRHTLRPPPARGGDHGADGRGPRGDGHAGAPAGLPAP